MRRKKGYNVFNLFSTSLLALDEKQSVHAVYTTALLYARTSVGETLLACTGVLAKTAALVRARFPESGENGVRASDQGVIVASRRASNPQILFC